MRDYVDVGPGVVSLRRCIRDERDDGSLTAKALSCEARVTRSLRTRHVVPTIGRREFDLGQFRYR